MDRSQATFKKYSSTGVDWAAWFLGIGLGLTLALQVTTMRWSDISSVYSAIAVQAPNGRNDRYTNMSVPVLRQRTLTAQSANINGVSGASYTSYGWYTSLVVALKQAGL